ncbi:HIT family protein [Microlunatus sp. GCM10028923]|uniref:HIT family protein n=1 Tax=Microlunatus sp. GCM10028923 TaxID=3273400 RepID=UPI003612C165
MIELWENRRWKIVVPERAMTRSHLALVDRSPDHHFDDAAANELLDAYRRSRSALWHTLEARGFGISFSAGWKPDRIGIGEPEPLTAGPAVHIFGRYPGEEISPNRVMAIPREDRDSVTVDDETLSALARALGDAPEVTIPAPSDSECDGCWPEVLMKQERWRADGVRVIRPRGVMIESQVILLPLRHVVSIGDLTGPEVVSMGARLKEVRNQFDSASGATGLSCFANDGLASHQGTPHVHLHVFGRSHDEAVNPFTLLTRRLTSSPPAG